MNSQVFSIVAASAAVTISVRALPILFLSRLRFPAIAQEWLSYIPSSIMASIIVSEITSKPAWSPAGWSVSALATATCVVVGVVTKSLFATVLAGVAAFLLLAAILP